MKWNLELVARRFTKLSEDDAFKVVIDNKSIQHEAIHLNRDVQLYQQGVDVEGVKMRSPYSRFGNVYSDATINIKMEKRQPTDRVTMRDTGALYKSIDVSIKYGELVLRGNTIKEGDDLQDTFGQFIGLNQASKEILIGKAKPIIMRYVTSKILR